MSTIRIAILRVIMLAVALFIVVVLLAVIEVIDKAQYCPPNTVRMHIGEAPVTYIFMGITWEHSISIWECLPVRRGHV